MVKSTKLIVYGHHAVKHCLKNSIDQVIEVWVRDDVAKHPALFELIKLAEQQSIAIHKVSQDTLQQKAQSSHHQGIAVLRKPYAILDESDLKNTLEQPSNNFCFLVLDTVQDPHNLGACFRSADAANIDGVIVPNDKSVGLTSTVCKVASGAAETVKFYSVTNLARCLRLLKDHNVWVFGLDGEAKQSLYQTDLNTSVALVLGAEGEGLRANTKKQCDNLISIPMHGNVESLNVSVASAMCLFETLRQRQYS